jgi:hypothetical protein
MVLGILHFNDSNLAVKSKFWQIYSIIMFSVTALFSPWIVYMNINSLPGTENDEHGLYISKLAWALEFSGQYVVFISTCYCIHLSKYNVIAFVKKGIELKGILNLRQNGESPSATVFWLIFLKVICVEIAFALILCTFDFVESFGNISSMTILYPLIVLMTFIYSFVQNMKCAALVYASYLFNILNHELIVLSKYQDDTEFYQKLYNIFNYQQELHDFVECLSAFLAIPTIFMQLANFLMLVEGVSFKLNILSCLIFSFPDI